MNNRFVKGELVLLMITIILGVKNSVIAQKSFQYDFLTTTEFLSLTTSNLRVCKDILAKRPLKHTIKQSLGSTIRFQFILYDGDIQDLNSTEYFYVYENQKSVIYRTPVKSNAEQYLNQFKSNGFKYFGKSSLDNAIIYDTSRYTLNYNQIHENGVVLFEILITDDGDWR